MASTTGIDRNVEVVFDRLASDRVTLTEARSFARPGLFLSNGIHSHLVCLRPAVGHNGAAYVDGAGRFS